MTDELKKVFEEAQTKAKSELERICLEEIHNLGISKTHTDFLGSHTVVTYPPLDALTKVQLPGAVFTSIKFGPEVDAYVHIPFCEYPCKFCPYTTLSINGGDNEQTLPYTTALKSEVSLWARKLKERDSRVRSLYVGGGTPFALPSGQLEDMLEFVRETLPFTEEPEICVETSPKATLDEDAQNKFDILRRFGTTRMSIGVQSFDYETLRNTARTFRGHKQGDEERAVRILLESGIPNINVDMIQDLPLSSGNYLDRLREDLLAISRLRPPHITWYNLRLRPETTFSRHGVETAMEEQSLHSRLAIWNFMEGIGYRVLEGDRFVTDESFEDNFRKTRGSVDTDLLGMGVSAYSHVGDAFFCNPRETGSTVRADSQRAIQEYVQKMNEDGVAISHVFPFTPDEKMAGRIALGLKRGVRLDEIGRDDSRFGDIRAYRETVLEPARRLIDAGLIEVKDGVMYFTRTGRLFENEICAKFYTPRAIFLAHKKRGTLTPEIGAAYQEYIGRSNS